MAATAATKITGIKLTRGWIDKTIPIATRLTITETRYPTTGRVFVLTAMRIRSALVRCATWDDGCSQGESRAGVSRAARLQAVTPVPVPEHAQGKWEF